MVRANQILLDATFCNRVPYNAATKSARDKLIPRAGNVRPENGTYGGGCFRVVEGRALRAHALRTRLSDLSALVGSLSVFAVRDDAGDIIGLALLPRCGKRSAH